MTCSEGWKTVVFAKQATGSTTFAAADVQDVLSENMQIVDSMFGGEQVIRGRRDRISQTVTMANIAVGGDISMLMNYKHLSFWLKAATGTSSTPFIPASSLLNYAIGVVRSTTGINYRLYHDCRVNTLTISGSEGGPITMSVSLIGKNFVDVLGALAAPAITTTDYATGGWQPFMFSNMAFTLGGSFLIAMQSFTLELNNFLSATTLNSLFTSDICTEDFSATLSVTSKAGDLFTRLYDQTATGTGVGKPALPAAVSMVLTHGSGTLTIAMPKWMFSRSEGGTAGRGTIQSTFAGECYADASVATPLPAITFTVT